MNWLLFWKESKTQFCLSDYTNEIIRATYRNLHKSAPQKLCASIVGNVLDENDCPFQIAITAVFLCLITTGDVLRLNHRSKGIHQWWHKIPIRRFLNQLRSKRKSAPTHRRMTRWYKSRICCFPESYEPADMRPQAASSNAVWHSCWASWVREEYAGLFGQRGTTC